MMGLPASVTKGDQRRFHFCRQCICRYHHSVATDLQRETEEILWLGMYEPIPFITIIWDNQWPWNLSIWHSRLSYLILIFHSLGHVSTLHTSSLFVVTFDVSYFPIVYIVLWFIMINKTLTVYIYISYIFFTALYHIPSSSIATSLILRTFPSLQQVEGSSPASLPLSSLDVPRLKRNLGLWNLKSFKRDRWNHRRWSACHFTEIAVPFSPKGWSVPWQFGWLLSRLSCQCLYVSRPVGWNHSGAAAAPASWTDQSWHIRRMPIDTLPQNMYPLVI